MSRKTRRAKKERHKRLMRRITLLEQANADPKRHNRKTRLRELMHMAQTEIAYLRADPRGVVMLQEATHADQA